MQQKVEEKIDPLTRIQEEIKEVVRREEEYRQLATLSSGSTITSSPSVEFETYTVNGNGLDFEQKLDQDQDQQNEDQSQDQGQGVLVTAQPVTTSLLLPIDELSNTPSLASSVNSAKEESLDGQHSDDSGISASSQSNIISAVGNSNSATNAAKQPLKLTVVTRQEQRYIGPNCYNLTPEPPQQKLITRTISTPQLSGLPQKRQFAFGGSTKGVMQRFIASHGKLAPTSPLPPASPLTLSLATNGNGSPAGGNNGGIANGQSNTLKLNTRTAMAFLESGNSTGGITSVTLSPAAIERDSEGRPLRRGYVPVEQKIQRELQDLKSRETELKRLRKINRQNTLKASLDKLQLSTDDEADADDDDEDSEVEHCYGPGKLRNAQSTQELDRNGNEQEIVHKPSGNRSLNASAYIANGISNGNGNGMRPAMSLAQLCDLTPEEAPSSRGLIAQWESLIKKNAEVGAVEAII
ncbi:uncharacterized protein LOC108091232 [Drosophila ficusphila]|uniref:uncharacterized protein LOC108091232 n=1 Tax=Drosophila ficusphila TaxID=30025 RepID=UPI0007E82EFB|nr:uncharacterized protein LOC108091232 [Drosophila ficusphila]